MISIFLRSLAYNVLFYALLVFWILVALPTFLMPPRAFMVVAKAWSRSSVWLMGAICNTRVEYRGLDKIPDGPLIVASKHQSMWETFALLQFFDSPLFIYKRELAWIPFFGWYLMKSKMIGIDRDAGGRALLNMTRRAGAEVRAGRQLIIFPEGTRTPVDAAPNYKTGSPDLCRRGAARAGGAHLGCSSRRTFMCYPGTLVVEFDSLPGLAPGIRRTRFDGDRGRHQPAGRAARVEQAQLAGRCRSAGRRGHPPWKGRVKRVRIAMQHQRELMQFRASRNPCASIHFTVASTSSRLLPQRPAYLLAAAQIVDGVAARFLPLTIARSNSRRR